jgi:hypothetical protein
MLPDSVALPSLTAAEQQQPLLPAAAAAAAACVSAESAEANTAPSLTAAELHDMYEGMFETAFDMIASS